MLHSKLGILNKLFSNTLLSSQKNYLKRAKTKGKQDLYRISENTKANFSPEISVKAYSP